MKASFDPIRETRAATRLRFLPPFLNSGVGSKERTTPVYDWLKSASVTLRGPAAGSLSQNFSRPYPSSTTKWLKFQNRIAGR